jgi:hypothetical protein
VKRDLITTYLQFCMQQTLGFGAHNYVRKFNVSNVARLINNVQNVTLDETLLIWPYDIATTLHLELYRSVQSTILHPFALI